MAAGCPRRLSAGRVIAEVDSLVLRSRLRVNLRRLHILLRAGLPCLCLQMIGILVLQSIQFAPPRRLGFGRDRVGSSRMLMSFTNIFHGMVRSRPRVKFFRSRGVLGQPC